jgi:hypothetical protein
MCQSPDNGTTGGPTPAPSASTKPLTLLHQPDRLTLEVWVSLSQIAGGAGPSNYVDSRHFVSRYVRATQLEVGVRPFKPVTR